MPVSIDVPLETYEVQREAGTLSLGGARCPSIDRCPVAGGGELRLARSRVERPVVVLKRDPWGALEAVLNDRGVRDQQDVFHGSDTTRRTERPSGVSVTSQEPPVLLHCRGSLL